MPLVGDSMHRGLRACAGAKAPVFGNTCRGDILNKRWQISRNPCPLTPAHPQRGLWGGSHLAGPCVSRCMKHALSPWLWSSDMWYKY